MTVYLDCNATTPVEEAVLEQMIQFCREHYANAGSRTHEQGNTAKKAVERSRDQVATVVGADRDEVLFTSGATEANNLAILGLAQSLKEADKTHIISTKIEHKAVLEPLEQLSESGFDVELLSPGRSGRIEPETVSKALRDTTGLVSMMHVNNETGIIQPVAEVASLLENSPAYFHVDAAQGFGKRIGDLFSKRIDLISVSAHKLYGPKGVGALIARKRRHRRPPLKPLMYGGGQERGLRPGTVPVQLVVALGKSSSLALEHHKEREGYCQQFRERMLGALEPLKPILYGDQKYCIPHVLSLSFEGLNSEAVMLALKGVIAVSNGSACTSSSYEPSHVLTAMGLSEEETRCALRFSWCHMTEEPDWDAVIAAIKALI